MDPAVEKGCTLIMACTLNSSNTIYVPYIYIHDVSLMWFQENIIGYTEMKIKISLVTLKLKYNWFHCN